MLTNKNLLAGVALLVFCVLSLTVLIPFGVQQPPSVQYRALSPSYWPYIVATAICALGLALSVSAAITGKPDEPAPSTPQSSWLALRPFIAVVPLHDVSGFR